ncbi:hypothetical protein OSTOST_21948 [Ostertagia ostertagi]
MLRTGALCLRSALRRSWLRSASSLTVPWNAAAVRGPLLSIKSPQQVRLFSSSNGENDNPASSPEEESGTLETAIVEGTDISGMSTINIPDVFPIVPVIAINRYPLFPGFIKKVDIVKDDALKQVIRNRVALKQPYVGVFVKQDDENKEEIVSSLSQLYNVGCFAQIIEMRDHGKVLELVLSAHRRIRILEPVEEGAAEEPHKALNGRRVGYRKKGSSPPPKPLPNPADRTSILLARTENVIAEPAERNNETKAKMQAVVQTIRDVVQYSALFGQQINLLLHPSQNVIENPVYLCDLVATLVQSADTKELQEMMEEIKVSRRLDLALVLIQKEKTVAKLKFDINKDVEKKVQDQHRKYLLNEQLKVIKKELGLEKDDKSTIIEKMEERLKDLTVPEYAMKNYSSLNLKGITLDWLTNIPWGITSEENSDLPKARIALDKGHYGMKDVKERILEFIAVNMLKDTFEEDKIRMFNAMGLAGDGKTSICTGPIKLKHSIDSISASQWEDVCGSYAWKNDTVRTENPLVLIDEVDKIGGAGYHGDPASALLELLDPEQNANFNDHFLTLFFVACSFSVLFICTANVTDSIPGPLKDRMELIDVSGYLAEEKIVIAQRYLIPQARTETQLSKHYCREFGVLKLRLISETPAGSVAPVDSETPAATESPQPTIVVNSENLEKYVIMGLAWTAMGGSALYIETVLKRPVDYSSDKEGTLEVTGNLGDVMKESVKAALTVAKGILAKDEPDNRFFDKAHIHIHVPEGATPKDGPSAGVTVVSSLLSLALNKPVVQEMAMTGEISLTGKVLPVGGIKEKVIAVRSRARRVGAKRIFLPEENRRDYDDLPDFMREDLDVRFVSNYSELYRDLFQ